MRVRGKKVNKAYEACIEVLNSTFSREELVLILSKLVTNTGYAFYYGQENPQATMPKKMNKEEAEQLYWSDPTTGTTLIKLGFDIYDVLLKKG